MDRAAPRRRRRPQGSRRARLRRRQIASSHSSHGGLLFCVTYPNACEVGKGAEPASRRRVARAKLSCTLLRRLDVGRAHEFTPPPGFTLQETGEFLRGAAARLRPERGELI